ncbi:MAG: D-glycero-beta-D-manno-heptose-7-phosphate kinase [Marinilabiliales bacterium]|nr:MAG: D-glycero-beta-D-manno-heptose-7-phosphate kinase [Marinilabiliales bacterium]
MNKNLKELITNKKILIIGDVMIDAYIWGKVDRISPEAPVPIVSVHKRENRLGGAANVALNIQSLGSTAVLASVIGKDEKGQEMIELVAKQNMPTHGLLQSSHRITTTKFRVIGNNTQMLRVDEETDDSLAPEIKKEFLNHLLQLLSEENFDAIVFEDYDKGVIDSEIVSAVLQKSDELNIPVSVDPKKRNFFAYEGVSLFKPNLKELSNALNIELPDDIEMLAKLAEKFRCENKYKLLLLTLGEKGMLLLYDKENVKMQYHIPSRVRNVSDVSGAGDTVISVATLALAAGLDCIQMTELSNLAAGIVCEYVGVVPVPAIRFFKEAENIQNAD